MPRTLAAIIGLIILLVYPIDELLLGILLLIGMQNFMPTIFGWGVLISFIGALTGSFLLLSLLLSKSLALNEGERSAGAKLSLRAIDVFWYIGAAAAALIAALQIDVERHSDELAWQAEMLERSQWAFYFYHAEARAVCADEPKLGSKKPSPDLLGALEAISRFCVEQDWTEESAPFHEIPVEHTCTGFANPSDVVLTQRNGRRGNMSLEFLIDEGLQAEREVFSAIEKIQRFCGANTNLQRNLEAEKAFSLRIELGEDIGNTGKLEVYIRLIAILIGLRLFRGVSEFRDEWQKSKVSTK